MQGGKKPAVKFAINVERQLNFRSEHHKHTIMANKVLG